MEQEHPASMTARAVKQALPDRAIVTKDARVMINTATSMFTLYLSTIAHDISTKNKRSTITLKDVLAALKDADFQHFVDPVEQCLVDTKAADARKRARKDAQKFATSDGHDAEAAVEDAEAGPVGEAAGEQEEVPMETDADLDGEQTIDEDDEVDDAEDDEDDEAPADPSMDSSITPSSQPPATVDASHTSVESIEDETMEETKSSE